MTLHRSPDSGGHRGTSAGSVACVVVNWNGGAHVIEACASLRLSRGLATRLILVDNGSTDGSLGQLEKKHPDAVILRRKENTGVACAWNAALEEAVRGGADYGFLLNDDAYVAENCLSELVKALESNSAAAAAAPRIFDASNPGVLWYDGGKVTLLGDTVHRGRGRPVDGSRSSERTSEFVTGCALMIRLSALRTAGMFDERYFAYCEDADWSFRARQLGFQLLHVPGAHAWHWQSLDTKQNRGREFRDYYLTRNRLLLLRSHTSGLKRIVFAGRYVFQYIALSGIYFAMLGRFARVRAIMLGVRDFLKGNFGRGAMR